MYTMVNWQGKKSSDRVKNNMVGENQSAIYMSGDMIFFGNGKGFHN